jgi:methylated-DNA-[protein]-cysteine S-methyltransferase
MTDTPFGETAVLWQIHQALPKILRILISRPQTDARRMISDLFPNAKPSTCSEIDAVLSQINAFLSGENIRFSLDTIRLDLCSSFQRKVLLAEYDIPHGRISTYRLIAQHLKNPKGARAVGTALANNPFPIVIPCHRAIRSNGTLGGYQGGLKMKQALLAMEGVPFIDDGRVSMLNCFYDN